MRNTKQNCFSHSSASPRNNKQCSAKLCFANQTNRCLTDFAYRSDLFLDNARLTKHRRKVYQRYLILQAMYTTMWLEIYCWLAVSHMFHWKLDSRIMQCFFFVSEWRRRETANELNRFVSCFLFFDSRLWRPYDANAACLLGWCCNDLRTDSWYLSGSEIICIHIYGTNVEYVYNFLPRVLYNISYILWYYSILTWWTCECFVVCFRCLHFAYAQLHL